MRDEIFQLLTQAYSDPLSLANFAYRNDLSFSVLNYTPLSFDVLDIDFLHNGGWASEF